MNKFHKASDDAWSQHGGFYPKEFACPGCGKVAHNSKEFYEWPENKKWHCDSCGSSGIYWAAYKDDNQTRISLEAPVVEAVPVLEKAPEKHPAHPAEKHPAPVVHHFKTHKHH